MDDGLVFDASSVTGSPIRKDAGYGGVRIDLRATLDGVRLSLHIDIGFGDAVPPAAQSVDYPTLLTDVPADLRDVIGAIRARAMQFGFPRQ